jgi:hypothetical protein
VSSVLKAIALSAALGVYTLLVASTALADSDPVGDTFNQGAGVQLDIVAIDAAYSQTELVIGVEFAQTITPPSAAAPNSAFATILLDTDQKSGTGFGEIGGEFQVETGGDLLHPGQALVASETNPDLGSAPMTFSGTGFEIRVPLSLIGDDGLASYAVIAKTTDPSSGQRPDTDRAPNSGVAVSNPSATPAAIGATGGPPESASSLSAIMVALGVALMAAGFGFMLFAPALRLARSGPQLEEGEAAILVVDSS